MWLLARALSFSICTVGRLAKGIPGHSKDSWCLRTGYLPFCLLCTEGRAQVTCAGVLTTAEEGWFVLHLAPGAPAAHVLHTPTRACGMEGGSH